MGAELKMHANLTMCNLFHSAWFCTTTSLTLSRYCFITVNNLPKEVFFKVKCFEFELLGVQPCWLAVTSWLMTLLLSHIPAMSLMCWAQNGNTHSCVFVISTVDLEIWPEIWRRTFFLSFFYSINSWSFFASVPFKNNNN